MARKDKPYLPLYVQDFMTDERLRECSASATGVYIMIMCVMHKSKDYGTILLQQKDKQNEQQILNFAKKLLRHLPYSLDEISRGIEELLAESCLYIDGDLLYQKRMVEDSKLSTTRSLAGKEGGKKSKKSREHFATAKGIAKQVPNSDIDIDIDIIKVNKTVNTEKSIIGEMVKVWMNLNPNYQLEENNDYPSLLNIAYKIAKIKGWQKNEVVNGKLEETAKSWETVAKFIRGDDFYKKLELATIEKKWTGLVQTMSAAKEGSSKKVEEPKKVKIVR